MYQEFLAFLEANSDTLTAIAWVLLVIAVMVISEIRERKGWNLIAESRTNLILETLRGISDLDRHCTQLGRDSVEFREAINVARKKREANRSVATYIKQFLERLDDDRAHFSNKAFDWRVVLKDNRAPFGDSEINLGAVAICIVVSALIAFITYAWITV